MKVIGTFFPLLLSTRTSPPNSFHSFFLPSGSGGEETLTPKFTKNTLMASTIASPASARPSLLRSPASQFQVPTPLATIVQGDDGAGNEEAIDAVLELSDGSAYRGISFGAQDKSVAGECVFQTGSWPLLCPVLGL